MTSRRKQRAQGRRERREARPALPAGPVWRAVARTARRYWWRILVVSIVVSAVSAVAEVVVDHLIDRADVTQAVGGSLGATGASLLGAVFLSGFLGRLVGAAEHGEAGPDQRNVRISAVLASLPWGSLILADLLVTAVILAGLVLLLIPGLIALNLLSITGPVIEIEHRRPVAGIRRSAHLVRQRFWRVALIATVPLIVISGLESVLPDPAGTDNIAAALILRSVGEGVLEALLGLLLVEVCYRLIAAERGSAAAG
jgi:uncharacterized membrane protein YhaH (DUF805 family)